MPVSYQSILITIFSGIMAIYGASILFRTRALKYQPLLVLAVGSMGLLGPIVFYYFATAYMWRTAKAGTGNDQFRYARWLESAPEVMDSITLFPVHRDWDNAWMWLERAADQGHPEAKFALGVRIKHDMFLPKSIAHNADVGQKLIDESHALGFKTDVPEDEYYFTAYRMRGPSVF